MAGPWRTLGPHSSEATGPHHMLLPLMEPSAWTPLIKVDGNKGDSLASHSKLGRKAQLHIRNQYKTMNKTNEIQPMGGMRCREETRQTLLVARHLSLQDISVSWPYYITVILLEAGPGPRAYLWGFLVAGSHCPCPQLRIWPIVKETSSREQVPAGLTRSPLGQESWSRTLYLLALCLWER